MVSLLPIDLNWCSVMSVSSPISVTLPGERRMGQPHQDSAQPPQGMMNGVLFLGRRAGSQS